MKDIDIKRDIKTILKGCYNYDPYSGNYSFDEDVAVENMVKYLEKNVFIKEIRRKKLDQINDL